MKKEKKTDDRQVCFGKQRSTIDAIPKITKYLHGKKRKKDEEPTEIMLINQIIPYKENTQLLGMTVD